MAVPNAKSIPVVTDRIGKKRRSKVRHELLFVLSFVLMAYAIWKIPVKMAWETVVVSSNHYPATPSPPVRLVLEKESIFLNTIKSCLPPKKCKMYIAEDNHNKQRVAVMTPPGKLGLILQEMIEDVFQQHPDLRASIDLIVTSHVPPYGYGKTHGLTKIIRVIPQPLMLFATDTALFQDSQISETDLQAVLRQTVRFHCRLSHVAAHTAMLSLSFADVLHHYSSTLQSLYQFLSSHEGSSDHPAVAVENASDLLVPPQPITTLWQQQKTAVERVFQRLNLSTTLLDSVLHTELKQTKNLTVWPCPSFWSVVNDQPNNVHGVPQSVAQSFSPNCSDPYSNCWVKRDLCEAKADAYCDGTK